MKARVKQQGYVLTYLDVTNWTVVYKRLPRQQVVKVWGKSPTPLLVTQG